jgi:hypothetical protein
VVNTSYDKIIAAFITGVHDNRCPKELRICEPSTITELYALVDECAQAEEGRWALECSAQAANDPMPSNKKKGTRKRASKQVLAAKLGSSVAINKKVKPNVPCGRCGNTGPGDMVPHS